MNLSRKEREREIRSNEILSAAAKIFAVKGFTHTTLDEIAEASEFGKGTLYNYFQNKEELYSAIVENIFDLFVKNLREIDNTTTDLKSFFTRLINYMLDFCSNNQAEFTLLAHKRMGTIHDEPSSINERMKKMLEEAHSIQIGKIDKAIKSGEIKEVDSEKLMILMRGMVFSYAYFQIACGKKEEFKRNDEVEFILSIIFNGITKN
jgi:AcrR family transcriptional regulator